MKNRILKFFAYITTFIIIIIIFNVLLYLSCLFSSNILESNVRESYDTLNKQGMFYGLSNLLKIINNNCTDTVIINESYSVNYKEPYNSYMKVRKNYKDGLTTHELEDINGEGVTVNYSYVTDEETYGYDYNPVAELGNFLNDKIHYSLNYGRYWHGYLILFRPLLIIFSISQIRMLLLLSFLLLFIYYEYLLNNRYGKSIAIIFGMSLILSGYFSASFSLESSSVFLVTMISSIILLRRIDKIKDFSIYLFIVACVINFVDYLTVPLISLGMLLSLYLLKEIRDGKDWKYCIKFVIHNSIIWMFGYACTWVFKWIQYDLTIGGSESMLKVGFIQSFYRMRRINENVSSGADYIYTIYNIISRSSLHILITLGVILSVNKFKISCNKLNKKMLGFLLLALIPICWYVVLANHTVMHYYFTYRQSLVFMIGILLAFNELFFHKNKIQ